MAYDREIDDIANAPQQDRQPTADEIHRDRALASGLTRQEAEIAAIIYDNWPADRNTYRSAKEIAMLFDLNKLPVEAQDMSIGEDGELSPGAEAAVRLGVSILAEAVSATAHKHGWWNDDIGTPIVRNMGEMMMLMVSELAEGLEAWRDGDDATKISYEHPSLFGATVVNDSPVNSPSWDSIAAIGRGAKPVPPSLAKPIGVASEFADTIVRILDTCHTLGIPVVEALVRKHAYNQTRPYRHGGKKA